MRTGTHFARKRYLRVLAAAGQLFPERRELGERRIGIDRTITLARPRTRRILPMRRTAFPAASIAIASTSVAAALVPAFVASAVFAIAELALVPVSAVSLAIDAIARPALPVIARFSCRHAINSGRGYDSAIRRRLSRTRFAEIAVTFAPPMTFAFGAVAWFASRSFAGGSRLRAFGSAIGATVPVAVMARRTPLLRPATGTPDLDQFRLCGCCGCLGRGGDITAYCFNSRFRRSRLDRRFGNNGWRHSLGIVRRFRFRLGDGCSVIGRSFGSVRYLREIDRRQQRR
jgi:hypothetical protein